MNYRRMLSTITAFVLAIAVPGAPAGAQGAHRKPPKVSFSNRARPASPKVGAQPLRHATQEELVEAVLGETANRLWDQADAHFHVGEYNHAVSLCRIVVQADPHNMEAFTTSGWLLWSTGRNEEAEAFLQEGIAANPGTYYMYDEMGIYWLIERKDPQSALPYYEKAVKYDCPFQTWHSLANCYEKTGQWAKAVGAWEKASLFPNNLVAIGRLKRARARLAQPNTGP